MKTKSSERVRLTGPSFCRFPFLVKLAKTQVTVQHEGTISFPGAIEKYSLRDGHRLGEGTTPLHLNKADLTKWRARAQELQ